MSESIFLPGAVFQGKAKGSEKFDLLAEDRGIVLELRYMLREDVEAAGAISYACEYEGQHWQLHYAVTKWLQRESYRVFLEGTLVVRSERLKLLGARNLNFADGTVWTMSAGPFGLAIRDAEGAKVVQSSPQTSFVKKTSKVTIEAQADEDKIFAAILILLHLSTHATE
jgi:hypothetical protein